MTGGHQTDGKATYRGMSYRSAQKIKTCYGIYTSKASQKIETSKHSVFKINAGYVFSKNNLFKNWQFEKIVQIYFFSI